MYQLKTVLVKRDILDQKDRRRGVMQFSQIQCCCLLHCLVEVWKDIWDTYKRDAFLAPSTSWELTSSLYGRNTLSWGLCHHLPEILDLDNTMDQYVGKYQFSSLDPMKKKHETKVDLLMKLAEFRHDDLNIPSQYKLGTCHWWAPHDRNPIPFHLQYMYLSSRKEWHLDGHRRSRYMEFHRDTRQRTGPYRRNICKLP